MFSKKLDRIDLQEIRKREELINQYILTAQALEAQKKNFIVSRFSKYGLDMTKEYSFDLKNGRIIEARPMGAKSK